MKPNPILPSLLLLILALLLAASARADHFNASWLEDNLGIWEQNGVWSTSAYPHNGHTIPGGNGEPVPGPNPTYDVLIGNPSPCTLGIGVRIQTLNVLQGSTLHVGNGGYLWANTGFGNAGLITLNSNGNFSGLLRAGGNSNVVPGGEIFMSDSFSNSVTAGAGGKILTISAGGRIRGAGNINAYHGDDVRTYFQIVNHGLIEAMQPVNSMSINLTDDPAFTDAMINDGTLRASGSGVLHIFAPFGTPGNVMNHGGTIEATDNGVVRLHRTATVTGGTLATSSNGTIRGQASPGGGTYKDLTNLGTMVIGQNETLGLAGTFINEGIVRLEGTLNFDTALFMRGATVVLAGNGLFDMQGGAAIAGGDFNGQTAIVGPAVTIRGKGEIGTSNGNFSLKLLNLVNQGLIHATGPLTIWLDNAVNARLTNDGGTLRASNGAQLNLSSPAVGQVLNSGGTVEALDGSTVRVNRFVTLEGGTLTSTGTGVIRGGTAETGGTIKNVTNSGTLAIGATERLYLAGTLTNNGLVRFEGTANGAAPLLLREDATIGGSGLVALGAERAAIAGAVFGTTLAVGPNATIRGNGTFGTFNSNFEYKAMRVINHGLIESTSWMTLYISTAENTDLTNSGGILRAASGALLNFEQPGTVTNSNGGSIEALNGGTVRFFNNAKVANYDSATQTLNGGTYIANGGTLDLNMGPVLTNAATVILSGGDAQFTPINSMTQNNGTFVLNGGVTRSFRTLERSRSKDSPTANIANTGSLVLANGASMNVNGTYSQSATGKLEVVIGSNSQPAPLNVTGAANLAGTLEVKLAPGYTPPAGQTFPLLNAASRSGEFVNVIGAKVIYGPNGLQVQPTGHSAAFQMASAVSRKNHGSVGDFDLPLPGIESRTSSGNHTLVFTFTNDLVCSSAKVNTTASLAAEPSCSGRTLTVQLANVADAQQVNVTLSGVTDIFSQVLPDATVTMAVLAGDADGNGTVSATDISLVKSLSGAAANGTNFRADVVPNGIINSSDIGFVKSRSGSSLP